MPKRKRTQDSHVSETAAPESTFWSHVEAITSRDSKRSATESVEHLLSYLKGGEDTYLVSRHQIGHLLLPWAISSMLGNSDDEVATTSVSALLESYKYLRDDPELRSVLSQSTLFKLCSRLARMARKGTKASSNAASAYVLFVSETYRPTMDVSCRLLEDAPNELVQATLLLLQRRPGNAKTVFSEICGIMPTLARAHDSHPDDIEKLIVDSLFLKQHHDGFHSALQRQNKIKCYQSEFLAIVHSSDENVLGFLPILFSLFVKHTSGVIQYQMYIRWTVALLESIEGGVAVETSLKAVVGLLDTVLEHHLDAFGTEEDKELGRRLSDFAFRLQNHGTLVADLLIRLLRLDHKLLHSRAKDAALVALSTNRSVLFIVTFLDVYTLLRQQSHALGVLLDVSCEMIELLRHNQDIRQAIASALRCPSDQTAKLFAALAEHVMNLADEAQGIAELFMIVSRCSPVDASTADSICAHCESFLNIAVSPLSKRMIATATHLTGSTLHLHARSHFWSDGKIHPLAPPPQLVTALSTTVQLEFSSLKNLSSFFVEGIASLTSERFRIRKSLGLLHERRTIGRLGLQDQDEIQSLSILLVHVCTLAQEKAGIVLPTTLEYWLPFATNNEADQLFSIACQLHARPAVQQHPSVLQTMYENHLILERHDLAGLLLKNVLHQCLSLCHDGIPLEKEAWSNMDTCYHVVALFHRTCSAGDTVQLPTCFSTVTQYLLEIPEHVLLANCDDASEAAWTATHLMCEFLNWKSPAKVEERSRLTDALVTLAEIVCRNLRTEDMSFSQHLMSPTKAQSTIVDAMEAFNLLSGRNLSSKLGMPLLDSTRLLVRYLVHMSEIQCLHGVLEAAGSCLRLHQRIVFTPFLDILIEECASPSLGNRFVTSLQPLRDVIGPIANEELINQSRTQDQIMLAKMQPSLEEVDSQTKVYLRGVLLARNLLDVSDVDNVLVNFGKIASPSPLHRGVMAELLKKASIQAANSTLKTVARSPVSTFPDFVWIVLIAFQGMTEERLERAFDGHSRHIFHSLIRCLSQQVEGTTNESLQLVDHIIRSHNLLPLTAFDVSLILGALLNVVSASNVTVGSYPFAGACLASLFQRYSKLMYGCAPNVILVFHALQKSTLEGQCPPTVYSGLCDLLFPHKDVYKKHLISLLLELNSGLQRVPFETIETKQEIVPTCFSLLDCLSTYEMKQLQAAMKPNDKATFRVIYNNYQTVHGYKGN